MNEIDWDTKKKELEKQGQEIVEKEKDFLEKVETLKEKFETQQSELHEQLKENLKNALKIISNIKNELSSIHEEKIMNQKQVTEEKLTRLLKTLEEQVQSTLRNLSQEHETLIDHVNQESQHLLDNMKKVLEKTVKDSVRQQLSESKTEFTKTISHLSRDLESFIAQEHEIMRNNTLSVLENIEKELNVLETTTKELGTKSSDMDTMLENIQIQLEGHLEGVEVHIQDEINEIERQEKSLQQGLLTKFSTKMDVALSEMRQQFQALSEDIESTIKTFINEGTKLKSVQEQTLVKQATETTKNVEETLSHTTIDVESVVNNMRKTFRGIIYEELENIINTFNTYQEEVSSRIEDTISQLKRTQIEIQTSLNKMFQQQLQKINQIGEQFEITLEKTLQEIMNKHLERTTQLSSTFAKELEMKFKEIATENLSYFNKIENQMKEHAKKTKNIHEKAYQLLKNSSNILKELINDYNGELHETIITNLHQFRERFITVRKTALNETREILNSQSREVSNIIYSIEQRTEQIVKTQHDQINTIKQQFNQRVDKEMDDISMRIRTIEQDALNALIHSIEISLTNLEQAIDKSMEEGKENMMKWTKQFEHNSNEYLTNYKKHLNEWTSDLSADLEEIREMMNSLFTTIESQLATRIQKIEEYHDSLQSIQGRIFELQKSIHSSTLSELVSLKRTISLSVKEFVKHLKTIVRAFDNAIKDIERMENSA